jgi:hypothetical protein
MRKDHKNKIDKAKEDYEFEKQQNECTFAPKTNNYIPKNQRKNLVAPQTVPVNGQQAQKLTAEERRQKTMQKQIDRMNKAREEKERVNTMTERGIPKSK